MAVRHSAKMSSRATGLLLGLLLSGLFVAPCEAAKKIFRAGAFAADITPTNFPVIVNGGFREKTTDIVNDRLHARCLVLDDGKERIAIVVVDSCMVPRDLLDQAKAMAAETTGIRTDRMMISSTHTHSAVSAMGALGSSADPNYIKVLPQMIANGIQQANKRLQAAKIGWAVTDAPDHTNCRRWILRPDKMRSDPFGETTVRAHMHPGHENPTFIGPSGPVDTGLSILSVQTAEGKPLAMFANFSMHYYGASALSAGYCGAFPEEFAKLIKSGNGRDEFIAAMSQGTSGDLQWMDYSKPRQQRDLRKYSAELAAIAHEAYQKIDHRPWVPLAMAEAKLKLNRRVADDARLEWARKTSVPLKKRKPMSQQEIYAREQILIADDPIRELILQAVRIGELGITAIPNEVYSITGLKLKTLSPFKNTFNVELANGGEGYIPPPEQHRLGGYTTWEARTASLETNAEPKIVETLLALLEKVAEKPRRRFSESNGSYARAVLAAKPAAYWRMGELAGTTVADSSGNGQTGDLESGFALHLKGPPGNGFSNDETINRSVQFAGGKMVTKLTRLPANRSIEFWFWNGLPASVRKTTGILYSHGKDSLQLVPDGKGEIRLEFDSATSSTTIKEKSWHHVAVVHQDGMNSVWLDGKKELSTKAGSNAKAQAVVFGGDLKNTANLEGRLDEIAVYPRALSASEIAQRMRLSGIDEWREEQRIGSLNRTTKRARQINGPEWNKNYRSSLLGMKPAIYWSFDQVEGKKILGLGERKTAGSIEGAVDLVASAESPNFGAAFRGGRIKADANLLPSDYSVSVWFRNDQPSNSRPVTGYFFSRGPDGDRKCPGDHLGIGGSFRKDLTGKVIVFNGNRLDDVVAGKSTIRPRTWNHVVMVRSGIGVTVYLNGNQKPEIETELPRSIGADESEIFFGGRNDNFSNLNGYLDEAAVFDRALTAAEAKQLYVAAGVMAPTAAVAETIVPLESPPLAPSSALRTIRVRDGYTLELMASEPMVRDPVAIDWGADGRLWVTEMADYPSGMDNNGKPGGRIRVLEDTDQDGQYDKSTLFLDGLSFPNGVLAWKKGVLITAAPEILYAEDTDGDGRADVKKVMYGGFYEGNQQLRVNGLRWGLDNWIYCANGSHQSGYGGAIVIRSHTGKEFELGSRDFKIRPETGELIPLSGPSQFGRARDDWGNWFGVQNSYPIWHYVLEDSYLQRNPDVTHPSPKKILTERNPRVYPAKQPQKRFHSFTQSGRFTSACSVAVYRDELLFSRDKTHAFTCEPFHNLVQHHVLTPDGVSFRHSRDSAEKELDFFTSTDRWCRPVQVRTGPDGALWVVDMYRYMIEHPQWLPPAGRDELRPHFRAGEERGRIYRIYPGDKRPEPFVNLRSQDSEDLIDSLRGPNGTVHDMARQLIQKEDVRGNDAFDSLAAAKAPLARLQQFSTASRFAPQPGVSHCFDPDPRIRRLAMLQLSDSNIPGDAVADLVEQMRNEKDPGTKLSVALTLGNLSDAAFGAVLADLANGDLSDLHMRAAVRSSIPTHFDTVLKSAVNSQGYRHTLFPDLLKMGGKRPEGLAFALNALLTPKAGTYSEKQFLVLAQWLDSLARQSLSIGKLATREPSLGPQLSRIDTLFNKARHITSDRNSPIALKTTALQILGKQADKRDVDLALLVGLLKPTNPKSLQQSAAVAMIRAWGSTATTELMRRWPTLSPSIRQTVIDQLLSQSNTIQSLLKTIEAGTISSADLSASQRQRLIKHKSAAIRKRANAALKNTLNPDRQPLIAKYQPALKLKADPAKGKVLFDQFCSVCHRTDQANPVGPDLRSITDKSPAGLLTAILDPNLSVDPRYTAYSIELKDDTSLSGRIITESGSSITLLAADAKTHAITRSQIAHFQGSRLSLMPEGLEAGLNPEQMADLIEYVRTGLK
ncbi:MAG: putative membrane-bound dehydrogenase-like protein [Limisphaerales bacterium]|jgi:putative membrane-bound dehydrogenase-like protein